MVTKKRTRKIARRKQIRRRASSDHQGDLGHRIELRTLQSRENEFRGRNVIVIGKEIYAIENGEQATRLLEELLKKYPNKTPLLAYVMEDETYILWH